ncbi:MAG: hypothetical protein ACM3ZC_14870 [Bacteroidota bacterium]
MEETERDRFERIIEAVTLARDAEQIEEEIRELRELAAQAKETEGSEAWAS